jgi:hypothetical protein
MSEQPSKPPVRMRVRVRTDANSQTMETSERLVVDSDDTPRKKREPNSGSMKKGETRNPKGRPKGAKGTKAIARKILSTPTAIRDGGRTRKVSLYQALLLKEARMAVEGDWRARKTVFDMGRWALPDESPQPLREVAAEANEIDRAILDWFAQEVLEKSISQSGEESSDENAD